MNSSGDELETYNRKIERILPRWFSRRLRWLRRPNLWLLRGVVGLLLIFGGIFSFLPVLGLWMLPLGLMLIAQDLPFLRPPLVRLFKWIESRWPKLSSK